VRSFIVIGAVMAALAVAAGAFGAHALEARLSPDRLATWETAARYHMYHALGLILVGIAGARSGSTTVWSLAGWLLLAGILVFCGTVYALALGAPRWLGAITPLGGLAFIAGWMAFAAGALRLP
jgi:uncharacterized membrane protein YgdD (TMEM256/DUF423 family)